MGIFTADLLGVLLVCGTLIQLGSSNLNRTRRRTYNSNGEPDACYDTMNGQVELGYCKWWLPLETIYFYIPGSFTHEEQATIRSGMDAYNQKTCLKYMEVGNLEYLYDRNGLFFNRKDGCWSSVGKVFYKEQYQEISLGQGCVYHGTVLHEVGHSVGWWHEQSRPDRNSFIKIVETNINPSMKDQFSQNMALTKFPYDYDSVMHYSGTSFTRNGERTILHWDEDYTDVKFGGKGEGGFSHYDLSWLNWMYGCAEHCDKSCMHEGYVDKYCNCQCPQHLTGSSCERVATGCGGVYEVKNSFVEITSPSYPSKYGNGLECAYVFTSPQSTQMIISVDDFALENSDKCENDYVEIRTHGIPIQGPKYCGSMLSGKVKVSVHNHMMIVFKSSARDTAKGFKITVSAQPVSDCDEAPCQNGGVCMMAEYGRHYCECSADSTGPNCEYQNGGFSDWSEWTSCPSECNLSIRKRFCTEPTPHPMGLDCTALGTTEEELAYDESKDCGHWNCPGSIKCDFNQGYMCGLTQYWSDTFDWEVKSGPSTNGGTGPTTDASWDGSGYYLYANSGYYNGYKRREKGDKAIVLLPTVEDHETRCLRFSYHLHGGGDQMLVANFYAWDAGKMELGDRYWNTAVMGNENAWKQKYVTIEGLQPPWRVAMEAIMGEFYKSDIGLDDLSLGVGRCTEETEIIEPTPEPEVTHPPPTQAPTQPPPETCTKTLVGSQAGLKPLNQKPGTWCNVFKTKTFDQPGKLTTWRYVAVLGAPVYLSVWRGAGGDEIKLIGWNKVTPPRAGTHTYKVPESEQITVKRGDVVGIFYPIEAQAGNAGVIYYEDSRHERTAGVEDSDMGPFVNLGGFDDWMEIGRVMSGTPQPGITRTVSLEADVLTTVDCDKQASGSACKDSNEKCEYWMKQGECTKNPKWMLPNCKLSCAQCSQDCYDNNDNCKKWADEGECQKNNVWMSANCRQSCGICSRSCFDDHDKCAEWASDGECEKNAQWMLLHCPRSCKICKAAAMMDMGPGCMDEDESCTKWALQGQCLTKAVFMKVRCRRACGYCNCVDDDAQCAAWAKEGECTKNAKWMKIKCRLSCGLCCEGMTDQEKCCKDKDPRCTKWAEEELCDVADGEVNTAECKKSCHKCRED